MNQSSQTLDCSQAAEAILDRAAEGLDPASSRQLEDHLSGCVQCAAMALSMGSVSDLFDEPTALPRDELEQRLVARVAADLESMPRSTFLSSAVIGVALGALGVILMATRHAAHGSWAELALCGGIWAIAFSGAVHLIRDAVAKQRSVFWGLTGLGIAVGTVLICPLPAQAVACEACRTLSGGGAIGLRESIGVFTLTGILFGGLLTWAMRRAHAVDLEGRTGLAAIAVIGAVGPALYLTCTPFSVGSLLGLAAGVLGGALGSAVGARVTGRLTL